MRVAQVDGSQAIGDRRRVKRGGPFARGSSQRQRVGGSGGDRIQITVIQTTNGEITTRGVNQLISCTEPMGVVEDNSITAVDSESRSEGLVIQCVIFGTDNRLRFSTDHVDRERKPRTRSYCTADCPGPAKLRRRVLR